MADVEVTDGTIFLAGDDTLQALHTPGHRFDHLSFLLIKQRTLFAGDLISGITTNVIAPAEGDMHDYLNSLKRLQEVEIAEIVPAHGPTIADAQAKIAEGDTAAARLLLERAAVSLAGGLGADHPLTLLAEQLLGSTVAVSR